MTTVQDTRLSRFQDRVGQRLQPGLTGPWAPRSLVLIALLSGFFLGSNITEHIGEDLTYRTICALPLVVIVELLIRLRNRIKRFPLPLPWQVVDNLRIGFVYALALEAFKVGS